MAYRRTTSCAALARDVERVWPGITIYWLRTTPADGDPSGHYPDDSGLPAEQSDVDTIQEVRANDFMIGPNFTSEDATRLTRALVTDQECRRRSYYVIYAGLIWSRGSNWQPRAYTGKNKHFDHVHWSGWAGDDENGANWYAVLALGGSMTFESDMNAYAEKYEGGPGETTEQIRVNRENWRNVMGTNGLMEEVRALKETVTALVDAVAGIVPPAAHVHTITSPSHSSGLPVPVDSPGE